jgi:hypothetical protein
VSRRKPNAISAATRSPVRLQRGFRGPVDRINFQPDAALDVICDGRGDGLDCQRLLRFEQERGDTNGPTYSPKSVSSGVKIVPDSEWTSMALTCRCGRPPQEVSLDVVRQVLTEMLDRNIKTMRVSAARLAAIDPPPL